MNSPVLKTLRWVLPLVLLVLVRPPEAGATFLPLPPSIAHDVLSETVPTAFVPAGFEEMAFDARDYVLDWQGAPIEGVEARLGEKSFEWVRVLEVLAIPRARLFLKVRDAQGGRITHAGFTHPLSPEGLAEVPVALISGERNAVEIRFRRGDKELSGTLKLRFKPRVKMDRPRIVRDASCSRLVFDPVIERLQQNGSEDHWVYLGCRSIVSEGDAHRTATLELYVFWDNVGQSVALGGLDTPANSVSLWALRVPARPGAVRLRASGHELTLPYAIPDRLRLGSLGVGLGPYAYHFNGLGDETDTWSPLLTVYGSYFFTEGIHIVGFNAISPSRNGYGDFGLYLKMENFRVFDRRFGINVLLGGHVIGFKAGGSVHVKPGFPQGMEMIYTDFLGRGRNISFGGFLYPPIDGKAYSNVWLRWGGAVFGEINYISWREQVGTDPVYSRSLGLTVGMPIGKFL